jgi:excisionase family DNA binding protein
MSVKALAAYSGLSVRTLRAYLAQKSAPLPHYHVGGRVLVRPTEFDSWMQKFKVDGSSGLEDNGLQQHLVAAGPGPVTRGDRTFDERVAATVRRLRGEE